MKNYIYNVVVIIKQQVKHLKATIMGKDFSVESYNYVKWLVNKFVYGNTRSNQYESYLNIGLEGLITAIDTFNELSGIAFKTYLHRCVLNALINEKVRLARLPLHEDENFNLDAYDGKIEEIKDKQFIPIVKKLIVQVVGKNERHVRFVELYLGVDNEPMTLNEIADIFSVSNEAVRKIVRKAIDSIRKNENACNILRSYAG